MELPEAKNLVITELNRVYANWRKHTKACRDPDRISALEEMDTMHDMVLGYIETLLARPFNTLN